mmetsp:Transcript_9920/g.37406  ORF Transcript_9920/g.37406 Transcript_9920/m.37406 type:complete len:225 (-) Transcript_9920:370-1044(-)
MVDVSGPASRVPKEPDGAIVGARNELLPRRTERNGHHSAHVILVDLLGLRHRSHVKGIQVVVFVGGHKVEGLLRVPGDAVRSHGEHGLMEHLILPDVVKRESPVAARGCDQARLRGVPHRPVDGLGSPLKARDRIRSVVVPDVHRLRRGAELVLRPVVIDRQKRPLPAPHVVRLHRFLVVGHLKSPLLDGAIVPARQEELGVRLDAQAPHEPVVRRSRPHASSL